MSAKRALVVDDSKSARMFLSRILERHEIAVDAAESAEQAIEYLARNRPDVIFMDHMMPGMDGFQAVQSIKNNPRTSAIPILMYTSQEGDLYLGQARALGAEGVLPKQIKQSDVTRMLYQLRLVSDRRGEERSAFTRITPSAELMPANESAIVVAAPAEPVPPVEAQPLPASSTAGTEIAHLLPQLSLEICAALDTSLQKEIAALRGYLGTTLSAQAERLHGDLAVLLPAPRTPDLDVPTMIAERRPWGAITGWSLALVATGLAAFFGWSSWVAEGESAVLRTDLAAAYAELEALRAQPEVVSPPPAAETMVPADATAAVGPPVAPPAPVVEATPAPAAEGQQAAPGTAPPAASPSASVAINPGAVPAAAPATIQAQ